MIISLLFRPSHMKQGRRIMLEKTSWSHDVCGRAACTTISTVLHTLFVYPSSSQGQVIPREMLYYVYTSCTTVRENLTPRLREMRECQGR